MEKLNKKAWKILRDDEKTSLSLSLGHGKSSWESGEIMGRAHFKYLEIQKRAAKFLEIFTNHFQKYGELIPSDLDLPFSFTEYLNLTMISRHNISTAVKQMESKKYLVTSVRTRLITKEIESLKASPKQSAEDLYNLIMDFDRWNNFRILPINLQEPSAYKRRNKARNIKHLKNITSLPIFSILRLTEKFYYSGKKYPKAYLPLFSNSVENGYKIIPIKDSKKNLGKVTAIGLFIFKEQRIADEFCVLVREYFITGNKTCSRGQAFWPEFRRYMGLAMNHKELENIHKSRTYLDNAIFTPDDKEFVKNSEKMLQNC